MALKVKVGLIGLFDMLKFKKMGDNREAAIAAAPELEIKSTFPININAKTLHPDFQELIVDEIIDYPEAKTKKFIFVREDGQNPANFRAGQYLSLKLNINGSAVTRPYSICSSPYDATRKGFIAIAVQSNPDGFVADYLLDNLNVGDKVIVSDPQGQFYYEELRDAHKVLAIVGGSAITPFLSMAKAISEGAEDFRLTILFGSRTEEQILFKEELDEIVKNSNGKVKVIHVLSDEEKPEYEHGFITADLITKHAPQHGEYSVFICGPTTMYNFTKKEVDKLGLPQRHIRWGLLGVTKDVSSDPKYFGDIDDVFSITVKQAGEEPKVIKAYAKEPLLVAFERAGIKAPSRCRSGECGWCRSQLISGDVFIPENTDGRRASDKRWNTIHPCASFPVSDCVIEVPGEYWE